MGKMEDRRAVPVFFALLPNKEAATYLKMWKVVTENVHFKPGLPQRIMSDFERGVMNTVKKISPKQPLWDATST
jgi:hypothetical protein